jgi:PAS domain-containing protein
MPAPDRVKALLELTQAVTASLELSQVLARAVEAAASLVPDSVCHIWVVEGDRLVLRAGWGDRRDVAEGDRFELVPGRGLAGWVATHRRPLMVDDVGADPRMVNREWIHREGYVAFAGIPIAVHGTLVGVICVFTRRPHRFSVDELELLTSFGIHAAIAVENARLYAAAQAREHELRDQRALLRATIDHLAEGVTVFDAQRRLVAWNRRFVDLLALPDHLVRPGTPMAEIIGFCAERGDYGPGDTERLATVALERAARTTPHGYERRVPGGRIVEIRGNPMPDGDIVTTYTDVTDRRREEAAQRQAEALRSVTGLANTVAHEINNPLAVIIGRLERLVKRAADPAVRKEAEQILAAGWRISAMLARMRAITRLGARPDEPGLPGLLDLHPPDDAG